MSEPEDPQVNPCGPQQQDQLTECERNPDAPGCDGGNPDDSNETTLELPPFLTPRSTIQIDLSTADREINIFNRNLFADVGNIFTNDGGTDYEAMRKWYGNDIESILYKANLLAADPVDTSLPFNASQTDRYFDYFRIATRTLWTWYYQQYEKFAPKELDYVPNSAQIRFTYGFDTFASSFDDSSNTWTSTLMITFSSQQDYEKTILNYDSAGETQEGSSGGVSYETLKVPFFGPQVADGRMKFSDNVFSAEQPFYAKELDKMSLPQFTSVSVDPEVLFFDEKTNIPETELPSLYRDYFHSLDENSEFEKCNYNDKIQKFTSDSIEEMKTANETLKNLYNQYVVITINTQQSGKISTLMDEMQMDRHMLEAICSTMKTSEREYAQILDEERFSSSDNPISDYNNNSAPVLINDRFMKSQALNTTDDPLYGSSNFVISTISDLKNQSQQYFDDFNHQSYPLKYENWNKTGLLRFTDTIRSQMFMNQVEKQILTKSRLRSYEDILSGRKAFSEIIGYKIDKHQILQEENEEGEITETFDPVPVQHFYLMDSDKVLTMEFVDTQVNPGKKYVYRIYSLNFVLGSKYNYSPSQTIPLPEQVILPVIVRAEPDIKIIEAPFFEAVVAVIERPPISPQASFLPFQGVDDKMQILLQTNFDQKVELPIKILDSDDQIINDMRISQGVWYAPLEYRSDSIPQQYQIFRRSEPPEQYSDFKNSDYVKSLDTQERTLLLLDDDFEPNKDYYYCFRTIDKIGISNPSPVFKVRIISYADGIFMDLKEYEMVPRKEKTSKICFQSALKIEPAFRQRAFSFDSNINIDSTEFARSVPDLGDVDLGTIPSGEKIWNKKYKIRITSKSSGKKVDLNIRFKKSKREFKPPELVENQQQRELIDCDTGEITPASSQTPSTPVDRYSDDFVEMYEFNDEALERYGIILRGEFVYGEDYDGHGSPQALENFRKARRHLHPHDIRRIWDNNNDGTENWESNSNRSNMRFRYELSYRPLFHGYFD